MNKIKHFCKNMWRGVMSIKMTTPVAVILGAIVIGGSIIAYGFITRPTTGQSGPRDLIKETAKELKLKGSAWEACLAATSTVSTIQREYEDGVKAGVTGTPTTFVLVKKGNVYQTVAKVEGAQSETFLKTAINEALSGKAKTTPFAGAQPTSTEFVSGPMGDVLVIEYADAQCPFCVRFHPTLTSVLGSYTSQVGFMYRHFPLFQIHQNAVPYAVAIECAGQLKGSDAYFSFIDKLLTKQGQTQ